MEECRDLGKHIAQFNQINSNLLCVDVKLKDEDKIVMLIYSLPPSFSPLTTILMFEKETLDYKEVVLTLRLYQTM